jgi:hypothetical protein
MPSCPGYPRDGLLAHILMDLLRITAKAPGWYGTLYGCRECSGRDGGRKGARLTWTPWAGAVGDADGTP